MDVIKLYSSQEETINVHSSQNGLDSETRPRIAYFDENSTRLKKNVNPFSTSTDDLVEIQKRRFKAIMPDMLSFVNLLHHTVFEDGMSNSAIDSVRQVYRREPYMTVTWLYGVYGMNQNDHEVIDGILRIIAFLEIPADIALAFIPMLRLAMLDDTVNCQEAAIMICEVWRTKECLEALQRAAFSDALLKAYADSVISELSNELDAHAA